MQGMLKRAPLIRVLGKMLLWGALLPVFLGGNATAYTDNDVVIVGAGVSGLYAAYALDQAGYDVLVVEATNRHGGRVQEGLLGDVGIELGAEELYGPLNNFIYNDIASLSPPLIQTPIWTYSNSQDERIEIGGSSVWANATGDADIFDYWDFFDHIILHSGDPSDPLLSDHLAATHGVGPSHRAYHLYDGQLGAEYGTTITRIGLRSLAHQEALWPFGSGLYGLANSGYLAALDQLYFDPILDRILYESPVVRVETGGLQPVVVDTHGVSHYGDVVLMTVSVGVLQAEVIDFDPDLPAEKVASYNTIGMGNGMKVFLRFSAPFWNENRMFALMSEGPTGMCWVPGKYKTGTTSYVLTCFIMGENAEFMTALGSDNAILSQALSDLDIMFSSQASGLFIDGIVQNWTEDPYVRGTYSYPVPGTYFPSGPSMREVLAEPVDALLFFAGEATHNSAPSTVPGAVQSGQRAAQEIQATLGTLPGTTSFSASVTSGTAPLEISFSDTSSGFPTAWLWDFGDGTTSDLQNPTHTYTDAGTYTVALVSTSTQGSDTKTFPELIAVPEPDATMTIALATAMLAWLRRLRLSH